MPPQTGTGENGKEGKRESNKNGKESKWEGTLDRGCRGSESEKKDGSGGIWRDAGLSGRIIEFAPGRSIRNEFRAKRDQHSMRVYVLV